MGSQINWSTGQRKSQIRTLVYQQSWRSFFAHPRIWRAGKSFTNKEGQKVRYFYRTISVPKPDLKKAYTGGTSFYSMSTSLKQSKQGLTSKMDKQRKFRKRLNRGWW